MTYRIPDSTLSGLEAVPTDRPVGWLVRHSVRGPLPEDLAGAEVPITEEGTALATTLGRRIGDRLVHVHHSPLVRCVQTARALAQGAGDPPVHPLDGLGHVRTFMADEIRGMVELRGRGLGGILRALFEGRSVPGFHDRPGAGRQVLRLLVDTTRHPGVTAFVSHDLFILALLAFAAPDPDPRRDWPGFLEGAFVWEDDGRWLCWYRERTFAVDSLDQP